MRLSRIVRHCAALSLLVIALPVVARGADRAASSAKAGENTSPAAKLVRLALEAEATGDAERRAAYIADALKVDPDYAPAHWHSGEVLAGKSWRTIDDAAAAIAGKYSEYRKMRSHASRTASSQIAVARWCEAEDLPAQQRAHLLFALELRPTKKQANDIARDLGLVRYKGRMMPTDQAQRLEKEEDGRRQALLEWRARIKSFQKDFEGRDPAKKADAEELLRTLTKASAVPVLESLLARCHPSSAPAILAAIAAVPAQSGTDTLVRYSLYANDPELRLASARHLRSRSLYSFAPTLIGAMQPRVEVQFAFSYNNGINQHRLTLYQKGPFVDQLFVSAGGAREEVSVVNHPISGQPTDIRTTWTPDKTEATDYERAKGQILANVQRDGINQKIAGVLREATGNDLSSDPSDWYSWWCDYNEVYQPPYRPVNQVIIDRTPIISYSYTVSSVSCFPAGTPVETSIGPLPIEQIRPGDCVLAQEPDTGELAYKPVMAITLRPASPLIEVRTAKETIRATRGHPFWISGLGWQMAKELKAGQWLHTTAGPVQIESAEQQGEAECHNLVVADFNSYFVGQQQILVHDNNLRQVTTATVPGLASD